MNELTTCPICLEDYDLNESTKLPRLLPCQLHSLCTKCLNDSLLNSHNVLTCPIDRKKFNIGDADNVVKNRFIIQYLERSENGGEKKSKHSKTGEVANRSRGADNFNHSIVDDDETTDNDDENDNEILVSSFTRQSQPTSASAPERMNQQAEWSESGYLKKIYDEIDANRDGYLSFDELYEALKRGSEDQFFDKRSVELLLDKHDKNRDHEISFAEFLSLYYEITELKNNFYDIDQIQNDGLIDSSELKLALDAKGLNLSTKLFDFVIGELTKYENRTGISFDMFIRVILRFQVLVNDFQKKYGLYNRNNRSSHKEFEEYALKHFFKKF